MTHLEDYIALVERLGCGTTSLDIISADVIYGMAQSDDNRHSVLHRLERSYEDGHVRKILLLGESACSGFSGFDSWKAYLELRARVPLDMLTGVKGSTYIDTRGVIRVHSGTESLAAVKYCAQKNITNLIVIAPEFHIARTFVHFVTAALANAPHMNIWPVLGDPLPWDEVVVHSQGTQRATRREIAVAEYEKIFAYRELATIDEVLAYMHERDKRKPFLA